MNNQMYEKKRTQHKRDFLIEPMNIDNSEQFIDKILDYSIANKQFEFISLFLRNISVFLYPENILLSIKDKIEEHKCHIYSYEKFVENVEDTIKNRNKPVKYGDAILNLLDVDETNKFIKYYIGNSIRYKQFEFISLLLRNIPVDWFPSNILICLLEETSQVKKLIPFRFIFWARTRNMINQRGENYNHQLSILK